MNKNIVKPLAVMICTLATGLIQASPLSGTYILTQQSIKASDICKPNNSGIDFSEVGAGEKVTLKYDSKSRQWQFLLNNSVALEMNLTPEGTGFKEIIINQEYASGKINLQISSPTETSFKISAVSDLSGLKSSNYCTNVATFSRISS